MAERLIESSKIRIGDISIAYHIKRGGENPTKTIVFLHGFPFNKNMWRQQLEALDDGTTGIAVDIRGHGHSTAGHGFFSIDVFAKDLKVFLEKLELDPVVLCGISMGGYIALRAYELFPERIAGLVLCDTHSKADTNANKQKRFDSIQAVLNHGRRPFTIAFVEQVFSQKSLENRPEAVELITDSIRRTNVNSICATLLALAARTDSSATLGKIRVPTLLIRGKEDKITARADMLELHQAIQGSEFVEMENCGHLPNLEDPETFDALLKDFPQNPQKRNP